MKFNKVQIFADTFICEDAVNIMNSSGDISSVIIKNTKFDSLDIDFSDLNIKKINIENSLNDCVDISASKVNITEAVLDTCNDKAFSIGEQSFVKVNNVEVQDSNIGIAVKDSSEVHIDKLQIIDTNICTAIYRKKQEFGPSKLSVEKGYLVPQYQKPMNNLDQNMKTENRFEIKFNMSNIELIKFKEKYRLINKMYPTRKITSYYYDTANLKYFYRSINRDIDSIKYRIRFYNDKKNFTEEIKTHTANGRKNTQGQSKMLEKFQNL